jgi:N-acetylated-alpha-linked acidic dipeptidase
MEDALPNYNAYAGDGNVTAELVYVNQGIPRDYERLERMGIDVEGKIVIARYGGSWRGIKVKVAAEHGAIGCILYSDPIDDGYGPGDVYPEGAFRNETGAQRGSVADMPLYPGDPLTPGVGATEDAERYELEDAPTLMRIPVLPISYGDAEPLLRALEGPVAPPEWRGGLPLTYHIGPGPAKVNVEVAFSWDIVPAYNVIARIEGADYPEQWVMRGNHHDAWVFGARDPVSGLVALLEEARGVGELLKTGWRPRRTLVYAAWDAEEPGLLGSTEWVEYHAEELDAKLALYINTDGNGRGFFSPGGSQTLEAFVNEVAHDVADPQTDASILTRAVANENVELIADEKGTDEETHWRKQLSLSPLGSGSDYTPFLQHAGVSSLNYSFGGESASGVYHSLYDTYSHFERFIDPGYAYTVALAEVAGRTTLRFANADVLPFRFESFADHAAKYLDEIKKLTDKMRTDTDQKNHLIDNGAFELSADPTEPFVAPDADDPVPYLAFAPLDNALRELKEAAEESDQKLTAWDGTGGPKIDRLNGLLLRIERSMTTDDGLPRRPWFKHNVYAPGFYTGYGVKTIPGVREAVEEREWEEAETEIDEAAAVFRRIASNLREASGLLE